MENEVVRMGLFLQRYKLIIIAFIVLIMALFIYKIKQPEANTDENLLSIELGQTMDELATVDLTIVETVEYVVDVKGAVKRPGVYTVTSEKRIVDIIELAGGFTDDAVEEAINLAAKITDEMVIYVPIKGEDDNQSLSNPLQSMSGTTQTDGKIHLNHATIDEITTLNGIGTKKAQAIIDYREEHGPFQAVEYILQVNGIGEKTLESFRDDIVVP